MSDAPQSSFPATDFESRGIAFEPFLLGANVTIGMPAYGNAEVTGRALDCLLRSAYGNYELLLLDNASPDNGEVYKVFEQVASRHGNVRILRFDQNVEYTGALNCILSEAQGDHVLFLSNDIYVSPAYFRELFAIVESHPNYGILRGVSNFVDNGLVTHNVATPHEIGDIDSLFYGAEAIRQDAGKQVAHDPFLVGDAFMVSRALLQEIGTLDQRFFGYFADPDFGLRAQAVGFPTLVARGAFAYHDNGINFDTLPDSIREERLRLRWLRVFQAWAVFKDKHGLPVDLPYTRISAVPWGELGAGLPSELRYCAPADYSDMYSDDLASMSLDPSSDIGWVIEFPDLCYAQVSAVGNSLLKAANRIGSAGIRRRVLPYRSQDRRADDNAPRLSEGRLPSQHDWPRCPVGKSLHFLRLASPFEVAPLDDQRYWYFSLTDCVIAIRQTLESGQELATVRERLRRVSGRLFVTSDQAREALVALGAEEGTIRVVSYGVDSTQFYPASQEERVEMRADLEISEHEHVFLSFTSLLWEHGLDVLLAAFARVRAGDGRARLMLRDDCGLFGQALDRLSGVTCLQCPELEELVAHSIYLIPANLTLHDLRRVYAAADTYVAPQRLDDVHQATRQAAACGLTVITHAMHAGVHSAVPVGTGKVSMIEQALGPLTEVLASQCIEPDLDSLVRAMCQRLEEGTIHRPAPVIFPGWDQCLPELFQ